MSSDRSSFASGSKMLNKILLDAVGDGESARQRPTVLHLTLLTFMELAEDGEKFAGAAKARQYFHSPSRLTVSKALSLIHI